MTTEDTISKAETTRNELIHLAETIDQKSKLEQLPLFDEILSSAMDKLNENTYTLLVCGEVKRGKSTFINGLLGAPILPTGVGVTTCQAFRISYAENEAYRLRFTDGSHEDISRRDMSKYGSQAAIDESGGVADFSGKTLKWIEIEYPAKFLPKNIVLFDTPGLGALYSYHAEITERFIPLSDSVLFVLDSDKPVQQSELMVLDNILKNTRHVFFIQTKIDEVDGWQEIQRRNEEILKDQFKNRILPSPRVWPISNTLLARAAEVDSEKTKKMLAISRYEELQSELKKFLEYVAGWSRTEIGTRYLDAYLKCCRSVLANRIKNLQENDAKRLKGLQAEMTAKMKELEDNWGAHGKTRSKTLIRVQELLKTAEAQFFQAFTVAGPIYEACAREIEGITSVKECKAFSEQIADMVPELVTGEFRKLINFVNDRLNAEYKTLIGALDSVAPYPRPNFDWDPDELERILRPTMAPYDCKEKNGGFLKTARKILAEAVDGMLTPVLTVRKWFRKLIAPTDIHPYKQQLLNTIKSALAEISQHVRKVNVYDEQNKPMIAQYFASIDSAWNELIERLKAERAAELSEEKRRIEEQIGLEKKEIETRWHAAQQYLSEWDALGNAVSSIFQRIPRLE